MKNKLNKIWILGGFGAVLLIILLAAGICWLSGEGRQPEDVVVFSVGENPVYLDEVNLYIIENVSQIGLTTSQLDTTTAEDGRSAEEYYKDEILTLIRNTKVTYQKAVDEGLQLTEEEEETIQEDAVSYLGSVSGSILREFGITKDTILRSYRERYLVNKYSQQITEDIEVDDYRYCTLYLLLFPKVEVDSDGNYVKSEDGDSVVWLSDEEIALKKQDAEDALKDIEEGTSIEEVAKEYGVDMVSGEESNLTGSFGEPFDQYAQTLKEGECSPVLDIETAYAIVQMKNENNPDVVDEILSYYKADKKQEVLEESVALWCEEYGVGEEPEWNGSVWDDISLYDFARYVEE